MNKNEVRRQTLKKRNSLSDKDIDAFSDIIENRVIELINESGCKNIYSYYGYGSEVSTLKILDYCLKHSIHIALPLITDAKNSEMEFLEIRDKNSDLKKGYMGIAEPESNRCNIAIKNPDIIIIPGVAFDLKMGRIGYGKGFYDKYISNNPDGASTKIALSFEAQIVEDTYCEYFDIRPDIIVTEKRIIRKEYYENE